MDYAHWIWVVIYATLIVGTMITVLMDNRQPAKTLAWLLVLTFLPIVGIVLYFFFGQNRRKEKYINQHSLDQLTERSMVAYAGQTNLRLPEKHWQLMQLFANQSMALPFKDNDVEVYTSGYEFFPALLQAVSRATHHVHLSTYIFANDSLGRLIADALAEKARQGVEIRVIYDDVGCWKVHNSIFRKMRQAGIDVQPFMPVHFPAFTGKINYRNHRKICIIDGQIAFIGGMNIALRYVKSWRDTHLKVEGGIVYALQRSFLVDWYFVTRTLIDEERYYPKAISPSSDDRKGALAQLVTSSPISPWPDIMQGYVRILLEAKQYVYMESPYFLPTEPILFAMRTAALAGVDVRLMLPRHSDAKLVEWASISYVSQVIEAGVKVYLYQSGFNHSKLLVSDDSLCTCGSTNIDFRSFENNFEANIFFYDEEMALRMKHVFLDDQQYCTFANEQPLSARRPFVRRLWESIIRLLSPLL
ncbi:MAG: cardiolipin synthase [Prevotella sp.]|nr:cardiolipin synthase [Prevotella sp.]